MMHVEWINLAQDEDQWRAVMDILRDLQAGHFLCR
jgi:hypothetical protein